MYRIPLAIAALALTAGSSLAQVNEGQFLAAVTVTPSAGTPIGELYLGDTATGTATLLPIPAQLAAGGLNAVTMVAPGLGFVSTGASTLVVPGDLYRITLAGSTMTATLLNTVPMPGPNISQLAVVGSEVLFTCQTAVATLGVLGKVSVGGGAPTVLVDFSTVSGYAGLANCLAVFLGRTAYVGTFSPSAIWEVDLATNVATKFADVPNSKSGTGASVALLVQLHFDPNSPATLVAQGVSGDYYRYNVLTKTLIDHRFSGTNLPAPVADNLNSFFIDARTDDYLAGTRDGNLDLFVLAHNGEKVIPGLGSGTTTQNFVSGLWYRPFTSGTFGAFGAGCSGQGGFTPTTFGLGTPRAGTTNWGIGMASGVGKGVGFLFIGASNTTYAGLPLPASLTSIGLPGCDLRVSIAAVFSTGLAGTLGGPGEGIGVVPFALPAGLRGTVAYGQWLALTNTLAVDAVSDARKIGIE